MKKILLFALGLSLVLALGATGCGDDDGGNSAEKIDRAWTKMNETKAVHEEFDMRMEIDGDLSELSSELEDVLPASLGVKGSADVDQSDEENIKADITIELDMADMLDKLMQASGDSTDSETAMGIGMISSMLKDINFRVVDQTMYMELMGSWYEMPLDESGLEDTIGGTAGIDLGTATAADTQCARDKMVPSQVLTDIEDQGKEEVGGTDTRHISASLDTDAMVDVLADISKECADEEMSDSNIAEAKDLLAKVVTKADIELWIDGDDNIRKLSVDMELDMSDMADQAGSTIDPDSAAILEGMTMSLTMTLEMSNFGETVDVEAPEDAMPMEDLLGTLGGLGGSSMDDLGIDEGAGAADDFDYGTGTGTSTGSSTRDRSSTNPSGY